MKCTSIKSILAIGILGAGLAIRTPAAELLVDPIFQIGANTGQGQISSSFFDLFPDLIFNEAPPSFFDVFYQIDLAAGSGPLPLELVSLHLQSTAVFPVGTNFGQILWEARAAGGSIGGQDLGGGNFQINGFFDIFAELSVEVDVDEVTRLWTRAANGSNLTIPSANVPDPASTWLLVLIPAGVLGWARFRRA